MISRAERNELNRTLKPITVLPVTRINGIDRLKPVLGIDQSVGRISSIRSDFQLDTLMNHEFKFLNSNLISRNSI